MTMLDDDLDQATFTDDAGAHVLCCMQLGLWRVNSVTPARFLCGVAFHPEMMAPLPLPEDDDGMCPTCVESLLDALCPPERPTHMHCPLNGRRCPE